ncbi:MAG: N-acetylmuramoyl-L-alanine amidase [Rhodospirillales bacterium]|nr:N-acetylmuramoyl-L-alanine amidase [Rhodospirillales bacterium]
MTDLDLTDHPSPNHGERCGGAPVDMLILHYTGMASAEVALVQLCDPAAEVSAHYLVDEDGTVVRLVPEERRAWHAGVASWRGRTDINSASIGIEIVNPGHEFGYRPFPMEQMAAVRDLCLDILERQAIPSRHVLGHSDVAPGRKSDPGELFDWELLARSGIGLARQEGGFHGRNYRRGDEGKDVGRLQAAFATFGYGLVADGRFGQATQDVVVAFQQHFRPERVDGIADAQTRARLAGVLAQCVDPG